MDRLEESGMLTAGLLAKLERIITVLANGEKLPYGARDHALKGVLSEFRECHIRDDMMLMYKVEKGNMVLILANIGGHSYLF